MREEEANVCTVYLTISINVSLWQHWVDRPPEREQGTKIRTVNDLVVGDVRVLAPWLFADIGDAVSVGVGQLTLEDLAVVDDAVVVTVGGPFVKCTVPNIGIVGFRFPAEYNTIADDVLDEVPRTWTRPAITIIAENGAGRRARERFIGYPISTSWFFGLVIHSSNNTEYSPLLV